MLYPIEHTNEACFLLFESLISYTLVYTQVLQIKLHSCPNVLSRIHYYEH